MNSTAPKSVPTANKDQGDKLVTSTTSAERRTRSRWLLLLVFSFCFIAVLSLTGKLRRFFALRTDTAQLLKESGLQEGQKEDFSKGMPDNSATGKLSVGYFVNCRTRRTLFSTTEIYFSHILYAFANIRPDTGEVFLSDPWADQDIHYPGDSWEEQGTNLYGNFKALYLLKKEHRHLKLLLSIGGWTYSSSFHPIVGSPALRAKFVETAVKLLEDYGLDGLDVDYEYPSNDSQASGYVELLRELRAALDQHTRNKNANYRFLLTIAAPCGPDNYEKLHVAAMDKSLDFWNLMAYDFSGSWDKVANHQANVKLGPVSAEKAIQWYTSRGVNPSKLIMGVPLYGRSFLHVNGGGPGGSFSGVGPGSWEAGVYDFRTLPLPGSYVHRDPAAIASWCFNYETTEMVSYDTEEVGKWKGEYIQQEGLGGSMFWELSGDKGSDREGMEGGPGKDPVPGRSLVKMVKEGMGPLDRSPNWLSYEASRFDNMRRGMN